MYDVVVAWIRWVSIDVKHMDETGLRWRGPPDAPNKLSKGRMIGLHLNALSIESLTILHVEFVLRVPFAAGWTLLLLEAKILPPLQGTANSATNWKEKSSHGNLALPVWRD